MTSSPTAPPLEGRALRLWPGVVIVVFQWLLRFVVPVVAPEALMYAVLGSLACGLLLLLWWLFFSRAPWLDRLGGLLVVVAAFFVVGRIAHVSIRTGMMGMLLPIYATPLVSLAFVAALVASRRLAPNARRVAVAAAVLVAVGSFALLRTGGLYGTAGSDLAWRWSPTPEERLLAREPDEPQAPPVTRPSPSAPASPASPSAPSEPATPRAASPASTAAGPATGAARDAAEAVASIPPAPAGHAAEWPGFRGPHRDGAVTGARLATDWAATPPVELWRKPVGPGWSSFAVDGDRLYTQEQRGEEEVVSCYRASTGEPLWKHRDAVRFWESNGGAGPRGTPTLDRGRLYSLGAKGLLNALDAATGARVWSRDAAADSGAKLPGWGFAGSPLVVDDRVLVATSGVLAAYDRRNGDLLWKGPAGGQGYSSPHLVSIDAAPQVVLLSSRGATAVDPADGRVLWEHAWPGHPIVQPAQAEGGDLVFAVADQGGTRRIAVTRSADGWSTAERWTSTGLKPYFNDFVLHEGHAYGFDGAILASIDLAGGARKWKGGRYGHGQLVLLPDQDLLLVLSEEGELALVQAAPDGFHELARSKAIEGKTWNHPVLVGDRLFVRNAEEMAAYRLPTMAR
jgi:outer membrane protein assembly factor BamB